MAIETLPWNLQDHLATPEDCAAYLEAVLELPDAEPADITRALGEIAKSKGFADLARNTGLTREALYKALSDKGNPTLTTLMAVARAFGLRLAVAPIADREAA